MFVGFESQLVNLEATPNLRRDRGRWSAATPVARFPRNSFDVAGYCANPGTKIHGGLRRSPRLWAERHSGIGSRSHPLRKACDGAGVCP